MHERFDRINERFDRNEDMATVVPSLIYRYDKLEERVHDQANDISDLVMKSAKGKWLGRHYDVLQQV